MTNTTAQDFRDMAAAAEKEKETSFERCDTDGFLSQWGHGMMAQQYRLQAEIEENGGLWEYAALFDLQGNLVPAKEVETRYGYSWALLDPQNPEGRFLGWFNESNAQNDARKIATDAKKGFYVGVVKVPAYAKLAGGNAMCLNAVALRKDNGFSADAIIVDNGK